MQVRHKRTFALLATLVLGLTAGAAIRGGAAGTDAPNKPTEGSSAPAPKVKVVSPVASVAYVVGSSQDQKLIVAIEIADTNGVGLDEDSFGLPNFIDGGDNLELFRDHIVGKRLYTNGNGVELLQIVSEIPVERLKASDDVHVSRPVDQRKLGHLKPTGGVPVETDLAVAVLEFKVADKSGAVSSDQAKVMIAFAPEVQSEWSDDDLHVYDEQPNP